MVNALSQCRGWEYSDDSVRVSAARSTATGEWGIRVFTSFREVEGFLSSHQVEAVCLKMADLNGIFRQVTLPVSRVDRALFEEGMGVGMPNWPGYAGIADSDMWVVPDPGSAFLEPMTNGTVLNFICDIYTPDRVRFERDPRFIAEKAEKWSKDILDVDDVLFIPELEFYMLDDVRYSNGQASCSYQIDSVEAMWNSGRDEGPNLGFKIPSREGHFCAPPRDHAFALRSTIMGALEQAGISIKYHHHEDGGAGQMEYELAFAPLKQAADNILKAKYIIRNVAAAHGKTVTFMPKPMYGEPGNGMHVHIYPVRNGKSAFYGGKYAGLNELAYNFIGGLLQHSPSLMAITNASTNSFRRFGRGLSAPICRFFSVGNRSASVRIPKYSISEREERIEYRIPDATCNPYLCLAGIMAAGGEGVKRRVSPEKEGFGPFDVDAHALSEEDIESIPSLPGSFEEALSALRQDNDFLSCDGIFDPAFADDWVKMKLRDEVYPVANRPHPYEFQLYYDR